MKIHKILADACATRFKPYFYWLMLIFLIMNIMAPSFAAPARAPEDEFTKVTLKNGLTLMYRVMKNQPVVSLNAVFRIGMNREEEKGIAHLVEHLIFRGGSGYVFNDIAGVTTRIGGQFNGFTTIDATYYNFTSPKESYISAFKIFNGSLWKPEFSDESVDLEKKIVMHELDMDYSGRYQDYPIYRYFFPEFSYSKETVDAITRQDLEDFHMNYYQPANTTYVITGDFDPQFIIGELEKVSNGYGFKELPQQPLHELDMPEKDVAEERNLYPYQYEVFMVYELKGLSELERNILRLLAKIYEYDAKIDYEKNEYKIYQVTHRSLNNEDYFGIYYLERNQPFSDLQYDAEKKNIQKYIREFKKIDLKKELADVTQQLELEAISSRESAEGAANYEISLLTDSDMLTVDSLPLLKKITAKNLTEFIDKYLNQPPKSWILVKTTK